MSTLTKPEAITTPPPSVISQDISPGHDPGTQFVVATKSPVAAANDSENAEPLGTLAPASTTTPFTVTSTDPPFQPSP